MRDVKLPKVATIKSFPKYTSHTVPDRQTGSFAHETVRDPLEKYILVPDLGADLVRVLNVAPATSSSSASVKEYAPLTVPPGTGPRHAVFWTPNSPAKYKPGDPIFLVVVGELSAQVLVYRADYLVDAPGMSFVLVNNSSTVGTSHHPHSNAPAELSLSVSRCASIYHQLT
jgi:6-phosphogluconolactonase (cycloisomerase 2 family)